MGHLHVTMEPAEHLSLAAHASGWLTVSVSKSFSLLPAGHLIVPPAVGLLLGLEEGVLPADGVPPADGVLLGLADGVLPTVGVPLEGVPPADGVLLGLAEGEPPADGVLLGLEDGVPPADGVPAGAPLGVLEGVSPLAADGVAAGVPLGAADGVSPPAADGVADGVLLGVAGPGPPMLTSTLMLPAVGGAALAEMQTSSMAYCSATGPG